MNELILTFLHELNASLAIGDVVSFGVRDSENNLGRITAFGTVDSIFNNRRSIRIRRIDNAPVPPSNAFILFEKNKAIEASGIIGYEATVTFKNTSTTKAELFAISSEVFESSR